MAKDERKTMILQAAGKIFIAKGFEGTKIEDIAKEAGIGKGTVYEYFESKQQLFDEMVTYYGNHYRNSIEDALTTGTTFRDKYLALAKYHAKIVKEHAHIIMSMSCSKIMAREMGAFILEQNTRVLVLLKNVVMAAIARKELRPDLDPELAAAVMLGTLNQYCGKKIVFYRTEPEEIDYEQVVDTVIRGIGLS